MYKRQVLGAVITGVIENIIVIFGISPYWQTAAVSYTHLDVYKRQVIEKVKTKDHTNQILKILNI